MNRIGRNIKTLRIQKNLRQEDLANTLFVTRQTISNYETGKVQPDVETLQKICALFGVELDTLLYEEIEESRKTILKRILSIMIFELVMTGLFIFLAWLTDYANELGAVTFDATLLFFCLYFIRPLICMIGGAGLYFIIQQYCSTAIRKMLFTKPKTASVIKIIALVLLMLLLLIWVVLFIGRFRLLGISLFYQIVSFFFESIWPGFILLGVFFGFAVHLGWRSF